ncbi:MAG TPA: 4-hydroxybenzoyl-CoA reductase subunit beta [Burkholderiaceae bacterium]|nr:4-hydroxybenzoyl-CoA reductase subunit beta [Burkholderiaceae bacterium]
MEPMPVFQLLRPTRVAEAVAARAGAKGARFLAGGTDLLANMRRGLVGCDTLIDLTAIAELRRIEVDGGGLHVGALVTLEALASHAEVQTNYAALVQAALSIAGPTHRACGTVGGNLCLDTRCRYYNQSEPWRHANEYCMKIAGDACRVAPKADRCYAAYSGDLAPALMVLDAVAEIAGPGRSRRVPLSELYTDDGMAHLVLAPDELLVAVHVPSQSGTRSGYEKLRIRGAVDFALAGVAMALRVQGDEIHELRIATTGTDSRPMMIADLQGVWRMVPEDDARLAKLLRHQIGPMETTLTSAAYRRRVVPVLARRLMRQLAGATVHPLDQQQHS